MPVKIRLMRIGSKKRPFYRVVAIDERKKRGGEYLELLGTYNPLTEPKDINLKQDRIDAWIKNGAVQSDGFLRIIGKAPQRPPRKPKKEQPVKPEAAPTPKPQEEKSPEQDSSSEDNSVADENKKVEESAPEQVQEAPAADETPAETEATDKNEVTEESKSEENPQE